MKPLRFAHISDTHLASLSSPPEGVMAKLASRGGDQLASLKLALDEIAAERPDFLIMTGDLCHEGDEGDYAALRALLDERLPGLPVMAALGNHDIRGAFKRGFLGDESGGDSPYFDSAEIGDIRVISLDTAFEKKLTGRIDDSQMEKLEKLISQPAGGGNIIIFHNPVCAELAHSGMELTPDFERVLRGGRVLGLFNGHVHRACFGLAAGVPHFTAPSLAFNIEVRGPDCIYHARGGYSMCDMNEDGEFFVDVRTVMPKGETFHIKKLG